MLQKQVLDFRPFFLSVGRVCGSSPVRWLPVLNKLLCFWRSIGTQVKSGLWMEIKRARLISVPNGVSVYVPPTWLHAILFHSSSGGGKGNESHASSFIGHATRVGLSQKPHVAFVGHVSHKRGQLKPTKIQVPHRLVVVKSSSYRRSVCFLQSHWAR